MKTLSIDIETFSSVNLQKAGLYKYAESEDFEILLFAYSVDGGEVIVIDIAKGETIPLEIIEAIYDENIMKWAFNAMFERICISRHLGLPLGEYLNPSSWYCTMIWCATLGLPLSLEGVGVVLGLDKQKLVEGKNLIKYFSVPCLPTKINGGRSRNLPKHDMEKWQLFKLYNARDVETEIDIKNKLSRFPVSKELWDEYHLDQEINDEGICIDRQFVFHAIAFHEKSKRSLTKQLQELTRLNNPNSVKQMKEWLKGNGLEAESLGKKAVAEMIKIAPKDLQEVLSLRQQFAKSSVKKYTTMENVICNDNRARGMFQFYGAKTGRFSGRLIQLQNLPQNNMEDLAQVRGLIRSGNYKALELLYDDIPDTLSQLIRTAFIPSEGKKFIVADFSAIEARVLAWIAGEQWRMMVFEKGKDIYCSSASKMFSVPVEKHGVNSHLRQRGKVAELGLGYGGSIGALKAMGALDMGLKEEELLTLVTAWRAANPNIVSLWWDIDNAVKRCVKERIKTEAYGISFIYQSGFLFIVLPSGRKLAYVKPKIGVNKFGGESVEYEGVGKAKKWEPLESYGPKFVENIVQAIARDILIYAMQGLRNYRIVAHVHDEIIIECDKDVSVEEICKEIGKTPPWAKGLLLKAEGYECSFYRKA